MNLLINKIFASNLIKIVAYVDLFKMHWFKTDVIYSLFNYNKKH